MRLNIEMNIGEQLRKNGVRFRRSDFTDILTCPVCTQNKPTEDYTIKEWLHMRNHLTSIAYQLIHEGLTLET